MINPTFYEFFAGGGMARSGLGDDWQCLFANDFSPMKSAAYRANWGDDHFHEGDVGKITAGDLPAYADLIWGSFPCQDVSLAGAYKGLGQADANLHTRSGTFWPFISLIRDLIKQGRAPKVLVLENVQGLLTANHGQDFAAALGALGEAGFRYGAMIIDAIHFLPQSRPRVFIVAVPREADVPDCMTTNQPITDFATSALRRAVSSLPPSLMKDWVWWRLPSAPTRNTRLIDLIENKPSSVRWDSAETTKLVLSRMSTANLEKVRQARLSGKRAVGGLYYRTRKDENGKKCIRAEVRFDDVAGCLRTPSGGSSRQRILVIEGKRTRSRLLSSREAARLMGLPDDYKLPKSYNDAYKVCGDGVAAPVVRFLTEHLLLPLTDCQKPSKLGAAEGARILALPDC